MEGFVDTALQYAPGGLLPGNHPHVPGWYAVFLRRVVRPRAALFARLVAWGEVLVGGGLIFGCLTGAAAFFGVLMNVSYLLAGAVSTNPMLAVLGTLLLRARTVSGYYGVDRYLWPLLHGAAAPA